MINGLNQLVEHIEDNLASGADTGVGGGTGIDVAASAGAMGVTEYHVRRMFSSVAGMPLSEYIRRRRMTVAAGDVIRGDDFLTVAVRYGYGSAEAFGRAFRAVHGISPAQARNSGGPLQSQPHLRFRLTVEGSTSMDARIVHRPTLRLIGPSVRVPLIYEGVNPHIAEFTESLPEEIHGRLHAIGTTHDEGPSGLLAISNEISPDASEGTELTYMHGVAAVGGDRMRGRIDRGHGGIGDQLGACVCGGSQVDVPDRGGFIEPETLCQVRSEHRSFPVAGEDDDSGVRRALVDGTGCLVSDNAAADDDMIVGFLQLIV
jgi:AraC family transcriptional regulator